MESKQTTKTAVAKLRPADFTDQLIEPFTQLRSEMDRLFESFPLRLPSLKTGRLWAAPALEMTETEKTYKITAEIPGIEPDDVDLTFEDGVLRIAGEKKVEREENERSYHLSERSYGMFERLVELPSSANPEKIAANFKNGVLSIIVEKDGKTKRKVRRIRIGREA